MDRRQGTKRQKTWMGLAGIAALALGVVALAGVAQARWGSCGAPKDPGVAAERLSSRLGLDDAQAEQVRGILEQSFQERDAILAAADGDRRAVRDELRAHREKTEERLAGVLTPEQMDELRATWRGRGRGHRDGFRSPERAAARMAGRLGLTDEQQDQVRAIFDERSEARQELRTETHQKLAQVLTPEQMAEFQEFRGPRNGRHHRDRWDCGDCPAPCYRADQQ